VISGEETEAEILLSNYTKEKREKLGDPKIIQAQT
jgi:hypothetical protein